jgi:hypothetical protein
MAENDETLLADNPDAETAIKNSKSNPKRHSPV